jgi:hypothetical protein
LFSTEERAALRKELIQIARADARITGAAITGSASVGKEDRWSDIDLAFGVREGSEVETTLVDFSERMYHDHHALHHVDVPSDAWIYRVFLLPSTLQVDLAFAPATDFGARAPTFRLVFGTAVEIPPVPPSAEQLIGYAWLYALHARSSIARARPWQAEYMLSAMRDQIFMLACLRHGLPAREGRGWDQLPAEIAAPLQETLVRDLSVDELRRAFRAATGGLISQMRAAAPELSARLEPALLALVETA